MGTKNNPSKYDCIAKAEDDEPVFTLLGRDPLAPDLVEMWMLLRVKDSHCARRLFEKMLERAEAQPVRLHQSEKLHEAVQCAADMKVFHKARQERAS